MAAVTANGPYFTKENGMKKKLFTLVMCALMAFGLAACGGEGAKTEEPKAIDEHAMSIVAKGFEKRADVITKNGGDLSSADNMKEAIQAEIDNDAQLKSAKFDDSKMQEAVLAYVNSLDAQMEVLDNTQYQSVDFFEKWQPAYDNRSALLKALVDNYGLTVGEKYQSDFNEVIKNGSSVQKKTEIDDQLKALLASAEVEKINDGYGYFTYTTVIENTTDYSYDNLFLIFALYDADGVRLGEAYASTNAMPKGEKIKFEGGTNIDAETVKIEVQPYYDATE